MLSLSVFRSNKRAKSSFYLGMMAAHVILDTILLVCSNFCKGAWKCFLVFLGATQSRARINLFKLFVLVARLGYSSNASSCYDPAYGSRYSRMDQVKFVEDSL